MYAVYVDSIIGSYAYVEEIGGLSCKCENSYEIDDYVKETIKKIMDFCKAEYESAYIKGIKIYTIDKELPLDKDVRIFKMKEFSGIHDYLVEFYDMKKEESRYQVYPDWEADLFGISFGYVDENESLTAIYKLREEFEYKLKDGYDTNEIAWVYKNWASASYLGLEGDEESTVCYEDIC